eukprot:2010140-Amphidinium_carterae.1
MEEFQQDRSRLIKTNERLTGQIRQHETSIVHLQTNLDKVTMRVQELESKFNLIVEDRFSSSVAEDSIYVCAHHISRVWHTPPVTAMLLGSSASGAIRALVSATSVLNKNAQGKGEYRSKHYGLIADYAPLKLDETFVSPRPCTAAWSRCRSLNDVATSLDQAQVGTTSGAPCFVYAQARDSSRCPTFFLTQYIRNGFNCDESSCRRGIGVLLRALTTPW